MTLSGGVQTDIITGTPIDQRKTAEAIQQEKEEAIRRRNVLELELQGEGGYVIETLKEVVIAHAETVLAKDQVFQMFIKFLTDLGYQLHVAPTIIDRHLKMTLPKYKANPPAPFGITGK